DDVIAVIMPNDPIVNSDWKTYKTTVDEIERTSGYDLLSLLPDKVESAVESNTIIAAQALNGASTVVQALSTTAGLTAGEANSLLAKVDAAQKQLGIGNAIPAANQLRSMLKELDAMVGSGRLAESDAAALRALVEGVLDSLA
ncbi:MAG: FIMAH domain-containing protein, partial [Gemmatimonadaceae bacterium]